jgi:hypothetical protein
VWWVFIWGPEFLYSYLSIPDSSAQLGLLSTFRPGFKTSKARFGRRRRDLPAFILADLSAKFAFGG